MGSLDWHLLVCRVASCKSIMAVASLCLLLFISSLQFVSARKDGPGLQVYEPCGGLQCLPGLHCCHLAVGCKQCCKNSQCPPRKICRGYKCVSIFEVEDKDEDKYVLEG